jgi:hypothetical protein
MTRTAAQRPRPAAQSSLATIAGTGQRRVCRRITLPAALSLSPVMPRRQQCYPEPLLGGCPIFALRSIDTCPAQASKRLQLRLYRRHIGCNPWTGFFRNRRTHANTLSIRPPVQFASELPLCNLQAASATINLRLRPSTCVCDHLHSGPSLPDPLPRLFVVRDASICPAGSVCRACPPARRARWLVECRQDLYSLHDAQRLRLRHLR